MRLNYFFRFLLIISFVIPVAPLKAQIIGDFISDESTLYAQTKQVNQFFRRFNHEEDGMGNRFNPNDDEYRNASTRGQFLPQLFDLDKFSRNDPKIKRFVERVTLKGNQQFLDFQSESWFAELTCDFTFEGKTQPLSLFFKLVKADVGTKWIIENIYFEPFSKTLPYREKDPMRFLHPLSHELDFMNIAKVFRDLETIQDYTFPEHSPDYLSIFLYELKMGRLQFKSVRQLKIHFFQIDGWYFSIAELNRPGYNSGWLITDLREVSESSRVNLLNRIYNNGR
ncbi:MAG: hypothetical protein ACXITV_06140 [Luteibaculaceae bacterium]